MKIKHENGTTTKTTVTSTYATGSQEHSGTRAIGNPFVGQ